jgi:4-hydroxybutyrate CoA-transferase
MQLDPTWRSRAVSVDQALDEIKSSARVFVHGAAATPLPLLEGLCRRTHLEAVRLYHLHLEGPCRFADPEHRGRFFSISLFTGQSLRGPIEQGRADFMPIFLSDIPALFTSRQIPLDVAIVQLSPPDRHGFCTLGTSVDAARAAVDSAKIVIAEINDQMPRTHGHSSVPLHSLSAFVCTSRPLPEAIAGPESEVEGRIGEIIAGLIEDGSTLQLGIGAIPNAVLARLGNKHDLGVHTEMFSDNLIDLIEGGVVTNRLKKIHAGRTTTSFVNGSGRLFDFVDDNLKVQFYACDRTNDSSLIRQNPKACAINSAVEIDLSGQVCADSVGHRILSGVGGQMDFIRGAALSPGGKPIIALPSTAAKGQVSRLVSTLRPGAGVVTTRAHLHWVVTEYGAVNVHGLTLRERGEALVSIAHPSFRAELARDLAGIRHFS